MEVPRCVVQDAAQPDSGKRQTVDIKFMAIVPGRKEYSLLVMSDCWIGADVVVPVKLKVTATLCPHPSLVSVSRLPSS